MTTRMKYIDKICRIYYTLKSPELLIHECDVMHTHKHIYLASINYVSIPFALISRIHIT